MQTHRTLLDTPFVTDSANQPRAQRSQSEDYVLVAGRLLGVFDSVGGRDHGMLVSHRAGKMIAAAWQAISEAERQESPAQLEAVLQAFIQQADTEIASLAIPEGQR